MTDKSLAARYLFILNDIDVEILHKYQCKPNTVKCLLKHINVK